MLVSWPPGKSENFANGKPFTVSGEAVLVITNTQPDSRLYVNVVKVISDDKECEDDEEDGSGSGTTGDGTGDVPIPEPPCSGCPRTSFFSDWKIPGLD